MIKESLDEYREICARIQEASDAAMRYSTTIVVVSGAVFVASAELMFQAGKIPPKGADSLGSLPPEAIAVALAIVICTLLLCQIVNYKCSSHNRLVAYRNLLAAKKFDAELWKNTKTAEMKGEAPESDIAISFDVCMDHLNHTYALGYFDFKTVKGDFHERKGVFLNLDDSDHAEIDMFVADAFPHFVDVGDGLKFCQTQGKLVLPNPRGLGRDRHDRLVRRKAAAFLSLPSLFFDTYKKWGTWGFPDQANRLILFVAIAELCAACVLWYNNLDLTYEKTSVKLILTNPINWALLTEFILCLYFLQRNVVDWQELSFGGRRIFSYFVQFIAFRMIYVKEMYGEVKPYYVGNVWELDPKIYESHLKKRKEEDSQKGNDSPTASVA